MLTLTLYWFLHCSDFYIVDFYICFDFYIVVFSTAPDRATGGLRGGLLFNEQEAPPGVLPTGLWTHSLSAIVLWLGSESYRLTVSRGTLGAETEGGCQPPGADRLRQGLALGRIQVAHSSAFTNSFLPCTLLKGDYSVSCVQSVLRSEMIFSLIIFYCYIMLIKIMLYWYLYD